MNYSNWKRLANELIPKSDNKNLPTIPNGSTQDIINEVLNVYSLCKNDLQEFAPVLAGTTLQETCSNIWHFIKKNIRYKEDPNGVQWIKTPARIWKDKICDCKGYSIFTACLLHALKIKGSFRFVSYEKNDKNVTHVYVIVPGSTPIIIDCVMPEFNYEKPFQYKTDYSMTQISRLSGIGCPGNNACGCSTNNTVVQKAAIPSGGNITSTEMALKSAAYNGDLSMTPESLAQNLLLLERLKIEMEIESKEDNWNDIRLAMYQEAISRVKKKISILEDYDSKIAGGLFRKILTSGKRKAIERAFNENPELGFFFLYAYIPNGEVYKGTNTRNLMAGMPSAVQSKAALQMELWKYLETNSQYGHTEFGILTRNALTKVLGKSPEQYLSEVLNVQIIPGERWWYGIQNIKGIAGNPLAALNFTNLKNLGSPKPNLLSTVTNLSSSIPAIGPLVSTGLSILKSLFSKKGVIESAFGIKIPAHLVPEKIGPDIGNDFGISSNSNPVEVNVTPIKKENTLVNQILNQAKGLVNPPILNTNNEVLPVLNDDTQEPVYAKKTQKDNTPLYLGGAALLAFLLFKK